MEPEVVKISILGTYLGLAYKSTISPFEVKIAFLQQYPQGRILTSVLTLGRWALLVRKWDEETR